MRGGTSRGPFFLASDLPAERSKLDAFLLATMGSPDQRQIDGLGGGRSVTSKVAIIAPSQRPGVDVDYTFAQVLLDRAQVNWRANCGNMLSGVGPAAILRGLVPIRGRETVVRVFNTNTSARSEVTVQTPEGEVAFEGPAAIDGVPGTGSPIKVSFRDVLGPRSGKVFPTGHRSEVIQQVRVTCIDSANPVVLMDALDLAASGEQASGKGLQDGREDPDTLNGDTAMLQRLEAIRCEAALRMGLGDARGQTVPKVCLLSAPASGGSICSRYFVPDRCHPAHALTGAVAVAVASTFEGTVAHRLSSSPLQSGAAQHQVCLEHPSGKIDLDLELDLSGPPVGRTTGQPVQGRVSSAAVLRTARVIMDGTVFVPRKCATTGE